AAPARESNFDQAAPENSRFASLATNHRARSCRNRVTSEMRKGTQSRKGIAGGCRQTGIIETLCVFAALRDASCWTGSLHLACFHKPGGFRLGITTVTSAESA